MLEIDITPNDDHQIRACDTCGRAMAKATKIYRGQAICSTCYTRLFKHRPCSKCGQVMRAHIQEAKPVCPACIRENRTCIRCGKPTSKAGMLVSGKAVCNACAPYFRKPGVCSRCNGKSTRLSKITDVIDTPVCEKCQRELTCGTCRSCGKHRRIHHRDEDGRAICNSCAENPGIRHACPDCGKRIPGSGSSKCRPCSRAASVRHQANLLSALFHNIHVKQLWGSFTEWLISEGKAASGRISLTKYSSVLLKVDRLLNDGDAVENAHFASALTAGDMRRAELLAEYLARHGLMTSNRSDRAGWSDEKRIAAMITGASRQPWGKLIDEFANYLISAKSPISPQSRRVYVRAAVALMEFADIERVSQLSNDMIVRFLRRKPGHRASLCSWLRFLDEKRHIRRSLPKKRAPSQKTMKDSIDEVGSLLKGLTKSRSTRTQMAFLAKLLSVLYAVPLETVLHLEFHDLVDQGGAVSVRLGGQWVDLDARLEQWVRWLMIENNPMGQGYLFPGRLHGDAWSTTGVSYQLHKGVE